MREAVLMVPGFFMLKPSQITHLFISAAGLAHAVDGWRAGSRHSGMERGK
jgi:hypothetical protein